MAAMFQGGGAGEAEAKRLPVERGGRKMNEEM